MAINDRNIEKLRGQDGKNFNEIRAQLFLTDPDAETAEAFDRAIDSGSIMRDEVCPVLDAKGNPLVVGGVYLYQKHQTSVKIKILRWAFGSGNLLDRYYRVFYTNQQLEDCFLVVNAQSLMAFLVAQFICPIFYQ